MDFSKIFVINLIISFTHFFIFSKGFIASCLEQPISLNENKENADFDALFLGDERSKEFKRLMFSTPKVHDNLRKLIPLFDLMGAFDME